ncbi:hypothetical protein D3C78_1570420 [compost metagenome]
MTGVLNKLMLIKSPYDITIPINLNEINFILKTVLGITLRSTSKYISTRKYFIREASESFPEMNLFAVHIDQ